MEKKSNTNKTTLSSHILLAEDDLSSQELIFEMLEWTGCTVDVVTNGKALLDLMKQTHFDLVLMNCKMPIIDGVQATKEIRRREKSTNKRIPIIALTADAMRGYKEKCLEAGMDDYLSKPFDQKQLNEILFQYLQLSE